LSDLSQKLWDLQLQSLDTTLAPVSWGAVEVKDEPVGESRASASERMHETKRSRRDFNRARAFESV
jgi:hypothetical protein